MACVAAQRENGPSADCTEAPAPAQELQVGSCGRVVSACSMNRAARPGAKGRKQGGEKEGGRGGISRTKGKVLVHSWLACIILSSVCDALVGRQDGSYLEEGMKQCDQ